MNDVVISVDRLTRRFADVIAVRDVSFQVRRADIFGLLGPNGSGKSTIIRMLCGVLKPSDGNASVLDINIRHDPESLKRRIGYMSQRFSLYADLTAEENLSFYARVYGLAPQAQLDRKRAVIDMTGLSPYVHRLAGHLSGGWKQRLALGCALIHQPDLLFLDEPTAGIDPVARRDLWDLFFELASRGITLFVTTHYMDEAERCTHVGYMYQSRLIAFGKPDELKHAPDVTPPGTTRFEVTCADAAAVLARARRLPAVRDATMFGDRLHLLLDESLSPDELIKAIAADDPRAVCRPVDPSLEDVFVLLTRAQERQDAA